MIPISNLEEPGRLKALFFGKAGSGKTTAAIMMPRPYVIDTEKGAVHYTDLVRKQDGALYHTNSLKEIVGIVKSLAMEKHTYLTLVIDPVTTIWKYAVDEAESRVGSKFGRHIGEAKKLVTKLENYLSQIDMNVICTSRAKDVFDSDQQTPDAWKGLDYFFDVIIEIEREDDRRRFARIEKSRIGKIEELSRWPWSYEELATRFGKTDLERGVERKELDETSSTEVQAVREKARMKMVDLAALGSKYEKDLDETQSKYIMDILSLDGESAADWEAIHVQVNKAVDRLKIFGQTLENNKGE